MFRNKTPICGSLRQAKRRRANFRKHAFAQKKVWQSKIQGLHESGRRKPLDISVYRPMKLRWREAVEEYKLQNPSSTSIDKAKFPSLLKSLLQKMNPTIEHTIRSGFEATGTVSRRLILPMCSRRFHKGQTKQLLHKTFQTAF